MKTALIQPAKFVATPQAWTENNMNPRQSIEQPGIIEIRGVRLQSVVPQSAAEAMRINLALEHLMAEEG